MSIVHCPKCNSQDCKIKHTPPAPAQSKCQKCGYSWVLGSLKPDLLRIPVKTEMTVIPADKPDRKLSLYVKSGTETIAYTKEVRELLEKFSSRGKK